MYTVSTIPKEPEKKTTNNKIIYGFNSYTQDDKKRAKQKKADKRQLKKA